MGTIICQTCNATITHFEDVKVSVLYAKCDRCQKHRISKDKK